MSKSLDKWAAEIHQNAVEHGWWDEERSFGDIVALCHSELSEALEEFRNKRPMLYHRCIVGCVCHEERGENSVNCKDKRDKPEGIAVEMIDCMIRILDWCGKEGIDVDAILEEKHRFNKARPYRHGGKAL